MKIGEERQRDRQRDRQTERDGPEYKGPPDAIAKPSDQKGRSGNQLRMKLRVVGLDFEENG